MWGIPFVTVCWFILTILLVIGMFVLFYRLSAWPTLAKRYRTHDRSDGFLYSFATIQFGVVKYKRCLSVRICEEGLYVAASFHCGYPPLFVPWTAIASCQREKRLFRDVTILKIEAPDTKLVLFGSLGEKVHKLWGQR